MDDAAPTLADAAEQPEKHSHPFAHVPVEIIISVGKARPKLSDLLKMGPQAVLPLDTGIEDPVELYIGDRLIARGELQELEGDAEGRLAVRLTEVADLKTGL